MEDLVNKLCDDFEQKCWLQFLPNKSLGGVSETKDKTLSIILLSQRRRAFSSIY